MFANAFFTNSWLINKFMSYKNTFLRWVSLSDVVIALMTVKIKTRSRLSSRKVALRGAIELYKACFVIGSVPSIPARS